MEKKKKIFSTYLVINMYFLPLLREKRCDVVALRSCQRDVTHQYKQIQNGGTETM